MKKTYIIPEALIVNLSMCTIIADSGPQIGGGGAESPNLTKEDVSSSDAGSKNVWDEEW